MKSLLVSDIFPPQTGGSGRWFWEIYRRLPREEYVIAAGEHPQQGDFDRTHDLRLERLPLTMRAWGLKSIAGLKGYLRIFRRLRRLAKAKGIERLHCARCLPEGMAAWLLKRWSGLPYLCYVHGEDVNTASTSREQSWMTRRVLRGADFLIPNSRNTERILLREWAIPAERIRLLYPGVDTDRFVPARRDEAVRQRVGWGERPVVLTVGRLQRRKGHDMMIRALSAIRRRVPDVLYAIAGAGEEEAYLRDLVVQEGQQGHVQFMGEIDDDTLIHCYQQCDLFALPNREINRDIEGFGMVLLEAQACGRPVLAGDSGGTAETMNVPVTGHIVNCEKPDLLADAVSRLLRDPEAMREMGQAARGWVVERFDWSSLSRQAQDIFQSTAGERPQQTPELIVS